MAEVVALGEPRALDAYLQPVMRLLHLVVGAGGSVLLVALGWWFWAPVPLAASFFWFELWKWQRADRPMRLELGPDIRLVDERGGQTLRVSLSDVTAATCWHRARGDGREVVIALYGPTGSLLALPFRVSADAPVDTDLDADAWDESLGAFAAIARAAAPPARACRQWFDSQEAVAWLRANVPAAAWARTAAQGWTGEAPPLDLFGFLEGAPDVFLLCEGARWSTADGRGGDLQAPQFGAGARSAVLFRLDGDKPDDERGQLPLLLVHLGELTLAIPCPAGVDRPESPVGSSGVHLQVPEGAALLAHLRRFSPGAPAAPIGGPLRVDPDAPGDTGSADAGRA